MMPIRKFPDPCLEVDCWKVDEITPSIHMLAKEMADTMYALNGVGIAAPQVGIRKMMFVMDHDSSGNPWTVLNPVMWVDENEKVSDAEGCLSLPGKGCNVTRATVVELEGTNLEGKHVKLTATGMAARVIQHEMDHLYGRLIIDRLDDDQRRSCRRQWWNDDWKQPVSR